MCSLLFLFITAILTLANAVSIPSAENDNGKLHLFTITADRMEGVYFNQQGGIHFISETDSIYISTMEGEGEPLLVGEKPVGNSRVVQLLQTYLVEIREDRDGDSPNFKEFAFPSSMAENVKDGLKSTNPRQVKKTVGKIRRLDLNPDVQKQNAINDLLQRVEFTLIEEAALKLIDLGIVGDPFPSALTFLTTAMRFVGLRMSNSTDTYDIDQGSAEVESSHPDREKRFTQSIRCSRCPATRCPIGSSCLGMCGPGCWWCWPICPNLVASGVTLTAGAVLGGFGGLLTAYALNHVFNDCCFHQGCYDHDVCCGRLGFFHSRCLIPIGFSCSGYRC